MAYPSRKGLGIAPVVVAGAVSVVSKLFGAKSGKTTHAQRFGAAVQAGDVALAKTLVNQAYSHAYLEPIPDKQDWQAVWSAMMQIAQSENGPILAYMNQKIGAPSGTGGPAAVQGTMPLSLAGVGGGANLVTLGIIGLGAAILFKYFGKRG